jgi:two-component system, NarL family, sensor histidine kinase UhpB
MENGMQSPTRFLVVEDSAYDYQLLLHTLASGGTPPTTVRAESMESVKAALDQPWDALICDYSLPGFTAIDVLAEVRSRGLDLPFLIVSGAIGEETAVEAMRAGAHDYVMKGDLSRLLPAIDRELREAEQRRSRREAEAALRRSDELFRAVIETSADLILILDADGTISYASPSSYYLLGRASGDLVTRDISDLLSPQDTPGCGPRRLLCTPSARPYEVSFRHQDGSPRAFEVTSSALPWRHGDCAVVISARSIDERKQADALLRQHRDRLRSLASELSLAEERERRRLAVDLHDSVGQSLALCRIRLEHYRSRCPDPALDEIIEIVAQVIAESRSLVSQISPPVLHELGLGPALEWLAEEFGRRHGLTVTFDDDGQAELLAHSLRILLFQCARELLTNVAKHAHSERASLSLRGADGSISVVVRDEGTGFDPGATTESGGGPPGFGLFSIRERLLCVGGSVEISSQIGRGAVITVTAPLSQDPSQETP